MEFFLIASRTWQGFKRFLKDIFESWESLSVSRLDLCPHLQLFCVWKTGVEEFAVVISQSSCDWLVSPERSHHYSLLYNLDSRGHEHHASEVTSEPRRQQQHASCGQAQLLASFSQQVMRPLLVCLLCWQRRTWRLHYRSLRQVRMAAAACLMWLGSTPFCPKNTARSSTLCLSSRTLPTNMYESATLHCIVWCYLRRCCCTKLSRLQPQLNLVKRCNFQVTSFAR